MVRRLVAVAVISSVTWVWPIDEPHGSRGAGRSAGSIRRVERTLSFNEPGVHGDVLYRIRFGDREEQLGRITCDEPDCGLPVVPNSFDIDRRGRLWVLDDAKRRVAVFDEEGAFLFAVPIRRPAASPFDLRCVERRTVALVQDWDFSGRLITIAGGERIGDHLITFGPVPPITADRFQGTRPGRVYLHLFAGRAHNQEVDSVIPIPASGHKAPAREVPGRPFLDGWLSYRELRHRRWNVIPLSARSSELAWDVNIRFRFEQRIDGEIISPEGVVVYLDAEVDDRGWIHYVLFAGTWGEDPRDGFWYLRVSPTGKVGMPVRLAQTMDDEEDRVNRHLTLGPDGQPLTMWLDRQALVVETVPIPSR